RAPGRRSTMPPIGHWRSRAKPCRRQRIERSRPTSSSGSCMRHPRAPPSRPPGRRSPLRCRIREADMLGRLTWAAIPFNEPLPLLSGAVVAIVILAVLGLITARGWWPYLWREWITSVDHKRIGGMYVLLGLVMLLRGFADAIMMRTQQAIAVGNAEG